MRAKRIRARDIENTHLCMGNKIRMILKIKVKPNSGKQEIKRVSEDEYTVSLKRRAENNAANIELIKLIKKQFNVEVKDIKLIKGLKSKNKVVSLDNERK